MRKRWYRRVLILILVVVSVWETTLCIDKLQEEASNKQVSTGEISNQMVIPGGMPIGIYMKTDGVLVLGTDEIIGKDGTEYCPSEHIVKGGDYIVSINDEEVDSKQEVLSIMKEIDAKEVVLELRRDEEVIEVKVFPVLCEDNSYKLGIWIRDSVQGLGTVTYVTSNNQFGALGHGIHDADTDELMEIASGRVYKTRILRVKKGQKGTPGGMEGMIIYNRYNQLGTVSANTENGIYGILDDVSEVLSDDSEMAEPVPVGNKRSVKLGDAVIRCCVSGEVKEYEIEIIKTDYFAREENKGLMIKVVDKELLALTGGIVQGMSGSPILQNGKIVGAVTHVLVNDPTRGYGIFIENMLETTQNIDEKN